LLKAIQVALDGVLGYHKQREVEGFLREVEVFLREVEVFLGR